LIWPAARGRIEESICGTGNGPAGCS
jgi:hypothetical protein